jgi:hypothetical protein
VALSVQNCLAHIEHTLGGPMPREIGGATLINQAGEFLASVHPWKWQEATESKLDLRAKIAITGGTPGSQSLTKANAFDNYTFLDGDVYEVTSGTNAVKGFYRVTGKTSGNAIALESDIVSSGSTADQAGTLHTSAIALPSDFREMIAINTTSGLLRGVALTDHAELIQRRAASFVSEGFHYGAIVHAQTSATAGGAPTPRLEIWPAPNANETGTLTMMYRAGWKTISNDTDLISIPVWIEPLYIQLLRAFARGYEEEDAAALDQRLVSITAGVMFAAAVDRDGMVQPHYGRLRGGGAVREGFESFGNFNSISAPS